MKTYMIDITETGYGFIRIKANSEEEAVEKFEDGEYDEDIFINKSDTEITKVVEE